MSNEPVIGGASEGSAGTVSGETEREGDGTNAREFDRAVAERLREALLAAHADLEPEDLAGESAAEVREGYLAARRRLDRERRRAPVPAGAPGRLTSAPLSAFGKIREGLARLDA